MAVENSKNKDYKNSIIFILVFIILILVMILFKLDLYRFDQIDKGDYEELIKTNKLTGKSYIFTDNGWETQEGILKRKNDIEINNHNKEIEVLNKKIKSAEQILNNLDEYTESIEYYNTGYNYFANLDLIKYSDRAKYEIGWEDVADPQIHAIIGDDVSYYTEENFTFGDAIKDKIDNYKKEIADITSKIKELEETS